MTKAKTLTAYLAGREPAPFAWRAANCTHFAGRYVAMVEGRDPLAGVAMPASRAAARRMVRAAGGLQQLVTRSLAREPIPAAMAQLGDVVLLPLSDADPQAQALGLCCGEQAAALTAEGIVTMHPMCNALAAWRVRA